MAFFRMRRIELVGARYLTPADVFARLAVDTTRSIWMHFDSLEARLLQHPQVRSVRLERKLPGTLVVRVIENLPVALVESKSALRAVDARGRELPIDPTVTAVDVPVVSPKDTAALRLLGALQDGHPELFARVSQVRRVAPGELAVQLTNRRVLVRSDVTADRFADILPVEADLSRASRRAVELDLRYNDQVIVRLP
jgi:cell division protein FtsQ